MNNEKQSIPPTATEGSKEQVDLFVRGDYVVTMASDLDLVHDGCVVVDGTKIKDVGRAKDMSAKYQPVDIIDGDHKAVLPGLVNGHTHAAMSLLRGLADDLELMDWLQKYIFPIEGRFISEEFVRVGTSLACWEMLRGGTTTFVDMYYFPDSAARVVEQCGMRGLISAGVIDQPNPYSRNAEDALEKGEDFMRRWQTRNSRVVPIASAHSIYTLNAQQLIAVRELADTFGACVNIHVAETQTEVEFVRSTYDSTCIRKLDELGLFNGPAIAAHVVWPEEDEIPILQNHNVGAVHNPTSNAKLASGIAPIVELLNGGVSVGLGTDGAASNNDLDMWEEMRLATFLQKIRQMNPKALPAYTVLRMATKGSADAIGLGDQIGSLEIGKRADLIQVDLRDVHHKPLFDIYSHLVYVTDEQDVATVVIDGETVVKDRQMMTIDIESLSPEVENIGTAIRAGLSL